MSANHDDHPTLERHCDVAVIGGSAAGLAAALQLARQDRAVVVVDDGSPRNAPADHTHGYLGREGAAPSELVAVGREEVRSHGGEVLIGRVVGVVARDDGRFALTLTGGHSLVARRVVAATGIRDELPDIPGLRERWGHEVVHCPFCHGHEVRDRRVVQVVTHPMGLHPTPVLRHLTDRLTVALHDPTGIDDAAVRRLADSGVEVVRQPVAAVEDDASGALTVRFVDGTTHEADAVLVGPRFHARAEMLAGVGVVPAPHESGLGDLVPVDPTGATSAPGVYAAGNLTDPTLQVLPVAAHGSRVGATVAFSLAEEDIDAATRGSGTRADWDARYGADDHVWSGNPNGTLVAEATDLDAGSALDVGAGEGADALWLAEQGWIVTAADIADGALHRLGAEAERRGVAVERLMADATALDPFGGRTFDLVSLQYGSFHRTPDERGVQNLLGAVAPDGTLLVVGHDQTALREVVDVETETRMYDPGAFVGVEDIHRVLVRSSDWQVLVFETRERPPGAASTHHVRDVVLRAVRSA